VTAAHYRQQSQLLRRRRRARLFCSPDPFSKGIMTMWAEQLPVTATAFVLKIGTALLITFAAMLVLVHAEIYFSHPLTMQHCMSELF
jgi:hypothetical protein